MVAEIVLAAWTVVLSIVWYRLMKAKKALEKREKKLQVDIAGYYWEASRRAMYATPMIRHQTPSGYRAAYSQRVEGKATYSTWEDLIK